MYRCIHISRSWLTENLLTKFIKRTDCLDLTWEGVFSEQAFSMLQLDRFDLVFASLPPPDIILLEGLMLELRRHRFVIASSIYPIHLYQAHNLHPIYFLKEPFSVEDFQTAIEVYFEENDMFE